MSRAGTYFRTGKAFVDKLSGEKPHSSISDWVEVLSSDRYDELSLDGIPELVDSINLQGSVGTTEASRAIRKKLKYGNVHRQIRALVILRALTDNAGKGFQLNWANAQLVERLQAMATDVSGASGSRAGVEAIVATKHWGGGTEEERAYLPIAALGINSCLASNLASVC
jgi:hypothetical protein